MPHLPVTTNPDATYSDIFNSAPTSMFIIDRDFKLAALNNRATERTKLALGEVPTLGVDVRPIIAKVGITNFEKHLLEAYAGKLITLEQPYNNPEVSWKWLEINYIPVKNSEGLIFTVCFSVLDISRRKYTEEALAKSVSINLALIKAIPDMLLRIDRNGNFVNYQAETANNSNVDAALQAKLVENALAYIELTLNSGKTQVVESELELEGSHRFFETRLLVNTENEVLAIVRDVTERKTVERTLLEKEQRYRLLAENISDMVVVLSFQSEYLYVSPSCEGVLGYLPEELIGKNGWDFIHPEDLPISSNALTEVRENHDKSNNLLLRHRHKEGRYIWLEGRGQTRFSKETKEPLEFIVSLRDVSRQIEAETALRQSEQRYRLLAENTIDIVVALSKVGEYLYASPSCEKVLGYTSEELKTLWGPELIHPDELPLMAAAIKNNRLTSANFETVVIRLRHKQGHYLWFEIGGQMGFSKKTGEAESIIVTLRDVTSRKRAEEALRNSEQLLRTVVSNAPLILFAFDTNGTLTFVDGKGLSYFNIDPKRLVGQHAQSLRTDINKYLLDKFTGFVTRALHGEIVQSVTKIGERYFEGVYTPVMDTEGQITGVICVSSDITQRVIAEEELKKNLQFERELSHQKSLFITTASHEFRTPLTIINSSAQLLEYYGHKWTDEHKHDLYQRIYLSVVNMTELLDDVLLLNKADAGKLEFNPVEMDFSQFCTTMLEEIQLGIGTKHQFDLQIEPAPVLLQGDSKLLRQIISNLLTNAIKYSAEGSTVHFRLGYDTNQVNVEIEDEGIGIPPEGLKHLFEVFYRAKNANNIEGTGLGMPIVKKCLDTHKGRIEVESELNKGTLYRVWIPLG